MGKRQRSHTSPGVFFRATLLLAVYGVWACLAATSTPWAQESSLVVVNPTAAYPEGPLVVGPDEVYYAEMGADRVMLWDGEQSREIWSERGCMPTSVADGGEGTLLVLCHHQGALVRITRSGANAGVIRRDNQNRAFVNPNASVNDSKGGVYFSASGDFAAAAPPRGAVMYLDADKVLHRVATDIRYANGVALTPDEKTLYVSEHLSRRVLAYDVADDGSLSGRRVFLELDDVVGDDPERSWEVGPDGLAVDSHGNLFIAEYGGGRLIVVDRSAQLLATVDIPEDYVTAAVLVDDERKLFVTAPVSLFDPTAFGKVYEIENPVYRGD